MAADRHERAHRQLVIALACFDKTPAPKVAEELAISPRQYYRERSQICKRIAKYIQAQTQLNSPVASAFLDPPSFYMERASARTDAGDYEAAIRDYEDVSKLSSTAKRVIEALTKRAEVEIERGEFAAARSALHDAESALRVREQEIEETPIAAARAHLKLVSAKLAWETGAFHLASYEIASARSGLEPIQSFAGTRLKQLYARVLVEQADHDLIRGDFSSVSDHLSRSHAVIRALPDVSPNLRIDLMRAQAELYGLSARTQSAEAFERRPTLLTSALELARSRRSLKRAAVLQLDLAEELVLSGDGSAVLDATRRALRIAKAMGNRRLMVATAVKMADLLSIIDLRKAVLSVLRAGEAFAWEGSFEWIWMAHLKADHLCKLGCHDLALQWGLAANAGASRLGSRRLVAATLRGLAETHYALGQRSEAKDLIVNAVPMAEENGSPRSLFCTYRSAATITGDKQYAEAAGALERLFA